jgi:hypothetical protein
MAESSSVLKWLPRRVLTKQKCIWPLEAAHASGRAARRFRGMAPTPSQRHRVASAPIMMSALGSSPCRNREIPTAAAHNTPSTSATRLLRACQVPIVVSAATPMLLAKKGSLWISAASDSW